MILAESDYGHRDKRGHYKPDERVSYPPVFVWPLKPIGALKVGVLARLTSPKAAPQKMKVTVFSQ